ncbi:MULTISPECIES: hypothetical protein [unclassified Bradyrhizobium]|uniref:hypothetical protein n=1 Tax=unclassified Bradyrhizobium TaxID=2631580 RepID=UPI001FF91A94|nr:MULTISPECIES: hypothetical protein [unclassified Bradyrhizobium]MCK1497997.1 hypothetical protein [Bradyrhizobium sp. 188]MCK1629671.1 hypothetical protein [Bradyrhizobium sp. 162]
MKKTGWVIVFESVTEPERYTSALIHRSKLEAQQAWDRGDQKGRPLEIIPIDWDDSAAKTNWP